ncbi:MAG TPA: TylF/MycF/NovP-related O-methyltransferase [Candidatus Nanoarchaeia archaeon]|nr:TylF/MycF/NovP-related O-methyltransferase [Candidatus Nanoarchaeia archaeon]
MLKLLREKIGGLGRKHRYVAYVDGIITRMHKDRRVMNTLMGIMKEESSLWKPSELFMVYSLTAKQRNIKGDFAEIGVYNGTSAKVICEWKGDRPLHLFDTFEGMPVRRVIDEIRYWKGRYRYDTRYVQKRLAKYPNVFLYKGHFPQTADPVLNKKFALAHFDGDLYQSAVDFLNVFYSRMQKGGVMLFHDYPCSRGLKKAVDEFFAKMPEKIIELPMNQCMVVKE